MKYMLEDNWISNLFSKYICNNQTDLPKPGSHKVRILLPLLYLTYQQNYEEKTYYPFYVNSGEYQIIKTWLNIINWWLGSGQTVREYSLPGWQAQCLQKKTPNIYCWQQSVKVINHTSDAGLLLLVLFLNILVSWLLLI